MRRRSIRNALIAVGVVLVLAIAAGAIALARFDPNSFKPQIAEAVQQATGRTLALNGPISLRPSLWPTVALRDVSLTNPPGFSRPELATLQQLDVQLALWPLLFHRVEIDRLVLVHPDIRLETNAKGEANWNFAPAGKPATATGTATGAAPARPQSAGTPSQGIPPQGASPQGATRISVDHVRIEDGTLAYRDDTTGRTTVLALHRLDADASSADAPLHLTADAAYDSAPFKLTATLGAMKRLLDSAATAPWPVQATLQAGSAKLSADGSLRQPLQGRGYDFALVGAIPDLAALAPFASGTSLPPLHDMRFSTRLRDAGAALPDVTALTLHVGASDLGSLQPGLQLTSLDVTAPQLGQSMQVQLAGQLGAAPLKLAGTLGPPAALLGGAKPKAPYAVDLTGQAAHADVALKGTIAQPATLQGVNIQLNATAPDLAALVPVLHRPLPALKSVAFAARLTDVSGGLAKGVALHNLKLTLPEGDVAGDMSVVPGTPPDVTAKLAAGRIDADGLLAAFRSTGSAAPPSAGAPAAPNPAPPSGNPPSGNPPSGASPPASHPAASGRLFPDTNLPFGMLRTANADLTLTAAQVQFAGKPYRNIDVHLVLRDGKLRLAPVAADLPEGHFTATVSADDASPAPAVALTLRAPALALQPLLAELHEPAYASGNLEVMANLQGNGASPHAIAATLDGSLGLALEHGTADTKLLEKLLGSALAKANLLGVLSQGGTSQVACFAFRMDARHGIGTVRTLVLSSSLLSLDGSGSVNLGNETLDMALRPQGRIAGTGFVVPLRLTGNLRNPAVAVNAVGTAESNIGSVAGALVGSATPLGAIAGVLIGGKDTGGGESCAGPLAIARGQAPSAPAPSAPAPSAAAPSAAAPSAAARVPAAKPKVPNPANLLRQLFR